MNVTERNLYLRSDHLHVHYLLIYTPTHPAYDKVPKKKRPLLSVSKK